MWKYYLLIYNRELWINNLLSYNLLVIIFKTSVFDFHNIPRNILNVLENMLMPTNVPTYFVYSFYFYLYTYIFNVRLPSISNQHIYYYYTLGYTYTVIALINYNNYVNNQWL